MAGTSEISLPAGACEADDGSAPLAYAIVSGIPARELPGTQFLIDDEGWLRQFGDLVTRKAGTTRKLWRPS